jgi:hypothetical protein
LKEIAKDIEVETVHASAQDSDSIMAFWDAVGFTRQANPQAGKVSL